ncbi:MAG: hypothetical protein ACLVE4_00145 [Longicatena caecimuris]|jgi:hypothetical protein|nr:hypothetical protein [Longicatena caecimuris]
MKMNKEECEKAIVTINEYAFDVPTENQVGVYEFIDAIELIDKLIEEHFDNSPIELEELIDGNWYWCNEFGWGLTNIYEDEDGDHYKFNTLFNGEIDLIDDDCNLYLMEVQND